MKARARAIVARRATAALALVSKAAVRRNRSYEPLPPGLSFREYVDAVRPGYRWYQHCIVLANVLQKVADRKIKRLLVFMPPRHGKSELVSRLFSAYWLYRYPEQWVAITSYGAELAHNLSRAARTFYRNGGGSIRKDAAAIKHWETGKGGGAWAAGFGGPATGKGWHLGIVDDPLKDHKEASSAVIRENVKDWYGSVFYTREEPNNDGDPDGALVIVQTRWHEEDLAGAALAAEMSEEDPEEAEGWHIVNLEAIKEEKTQRFPKTCSVEPDWRGVGEALNPERRPLRKLERIRRRIGDYFFSALYQQRPSPKDGTLFKVGRIEIVSDMPSGLKSCRAWDIAATENAGDHTAGVRMHGPDFNGLFYVQPKRFQHEPAQRNAEIKQTAALDGVAVTIRIPQDPGAGGKEAAQALVRTLAGYNVKAQTVSGDKFQRAEPFAAQVNAGNVRLYLPDDATEKQRRDATDYIEELRQAPTGKHDDFIDASSDAFNELCAIEEYEDAYEPPDEQHYASYTPR